MTTDVLLNKTKGYYDFDWTESGDISTTESFDTAILLSIFAEVRASAEEIPESRRRRGWHGNESTPGFEQGSKTWLFEQERTTQTMLEELGVVVNNGQQWLIEDDIVKSVEVGTPFLLNNQVVVPIDFGRDGSKVERRFFELWENTGSF